MARQPFVLLKKTYTHSSRVHEIVRILLKYGYGDLLVKFSLDNIPGLRLDPEEDFEITELRALPREVRVRRALEELGPTFIKFGQVISSQSRVLPREYIDELEFLQDEVPPENFEAIKKVIEEEFDKKLDELFSEFDQEPIGSASIGQAHRAVLHSGEEVIVKVQRPGIQKQVAIDVDILHHLADMVERHWDAATAYHPTDVVENFSHVIHQELDYLNEVANLQRFASHFSNDRRTYVPRVFRDFCTERVMTMELIDGTPMNSLDVNSIEEGDRKKLASHIFKTFLDQFFQFGFFHGDPHSGNLFHLEKDKIAYIDFGMMGALSLNERNNFESVIFAMASDEPQVLVDSILSITEYQQEPDRDELEKALAGYYHEHFDQSLEQINVGGALSDLVDMLAEYGLRLRPSYLLVIKAMAMIEGIGNRLNPDFNPIEEAKPYIKRRRMRRFDPRTMIQDFLSSGSSVYDDLKVIPSDVRHVLQNIKDGNWNIRFDHKSLKSALIDLESAMDRLSLAILIGSLGIGSSIVILADIPPRFGDIPLLGLLGFGMAGILTVIEVFSLMKQSKIPDDDEDD